MFHERGRRTQEAVKKYFEDVMEKIYLHSDGALSISAMMLVS